MTPQDESKMDRRRLLLGGAAVPLLLATNGCGYLLYPERNGRRGGNIDIPVLIIDLLWLIPGVVPGAICLIVDFASGCIYGGGGRSARPLAPGEIDPGPATAAVAIDGTVVASAEIKSDRKAHLTWKQTVDHASVRARGRLVLQRADGARAEAYVRDLI